jgi:hypothetical protein
MNVDHGGIALAYSAKPALSVFEGQCSCIARAHRAEGEFMPDVIARSEATKQSIGAFVLAMDCFAALAMTVSAAAV